jgi:hypothetical protein
MPMDTILMEIVTVEFEIEFHYFHDTLNESVDNDAVAVDH